MICCYSQLLWRLDRQSDNGIFCFAMLCFFNFMYSYIVFLIHWNAASLIAASIGDCSMHGAFMQ